MPFPIPPAGGAPPASETPRRHEPRPNAVSPALAERMLASLKDRGVEAVLILAPHTAGLPDDCRHDHGIVLPIEEAMRRAHLPHSPSCSCSYAAADQT